jgi:hypothetical protein
LQFFAWEDNFIEKVEAVRAKEMVQLTKSIWLKVVETCCWEVTPTLVSVLTFGTYALTGNELTAAVAFPALCRCSLELKLTIHSAVHHYGLRNECTANHGKLWHQVQCFSWTTEKVFAG